MIDIAYIVCGSEEEAYSIGEKLVSEELCACVNVIHGMKSIYKWKDNIEKSEETVLLAKTPQGGYKNIERRVKDLHSYEVPCIMKLEVADAHPFYLNWIKEEVKL